MLIFSLAPIFPNMKNSLISGAHSIWGMNPTFAMGIAYSLGIGLIFLLIQPAALHRAAQVMSMATAALFAFWVTVPTGEAGPWLGLLFSLGLGCCSGLALFGFTYALNDTERLFGATLTVLFCMLSQLIMSFPFLQHMSGTLYLGAQVLVTLLCLTRFHPADYAANCQGSRHRAVSSWLLCCLSSSRIGQSSFFTAICPTRPTTR